MSLNFFYLLTKLLFVLLQWGVYQRENLKILRKMLVNTD